VLCVQSIENTITAKVGYVLWLLAGAAAARDVRVRARGGTDSQGQFGSGLGWCGAARSWDLRAGTFKRSFESRYFGTCPRGQVAGPADQPGPGGGGPQLFLRGDKDRGWWTRWTCLFGNRGVTLIGTKKTKNKARPRPVTHSLNPWSTWSTIVYLYDRVRWTVDQWGMVQAGPPGPQ
jgi:hypothetical protein